MSHKMSHFSFFRHRHMSDLRRLCVLLGFHTATFQAGRGWPDLTSGQDVYRCCSEVLLWTIDALWFLPSHLIITLLWLTRVSPAVNSFRVQHKVTFWELLPQIILWNRFYLSDFIIQQVCLILWNTSVWQMCRKNLSQVKKHPSTHFR